MKRLGCSGLMVLLVLALLFALPAPLALAAPGDATEVYLGAAVQLDSATPYWQNGSAAASATVPAGGWNAYFDAGSATLHLQNAYIDAMPTASSANPWDALLACNGNLTIQLDERSELAYSNTIGPAPYPSYGLYAFGNVTFTGAGSLWITMETRTSIEAIHAEYGAFINGGSLHINVVAELAVGVRLAGDILSIDGGTIDMDVRGASARGIYGSSALMRLMRGGVTIQTNAMMNISVGVHVESISLEGGTADVRASGQSAYALIYQADTLYARGGHFLFAGDASALGGYAGVITPDKPESGMRIDVSELADGSGSKRWFSPADGELVTVTSTSPFRYVAFTMEAVMPQTGDSRTPLWWTGLSALALLGALGITGAARFWRRRQV